MNVQVRKVTIVVVVLFAALFVNLNLIAIVQADIVELARTDDFAVVTEDRLRDDPRNTRGLIREYEVPRGQIVAGERGDAIAVARSEETDGRLRYQRVYPEGTAFAHLTGFHSFVYGRSGLEREYNDALAGRGAGALTRNLADLLAGREPPGETLRLEIDPVVQNAAVGQLDGRTGAIVALEPETGAVLAMASSPRYDPNPLASHDGSEVREAWQRLEDDAANPRLNRALSETYAPGSTFKIITAAAALERGYRADSRFDDPVRLELPLTTATIGNFGGGVCADGNEITLEQGLVVSCNTTFGQIALDLGGDALVDTAEAFGINDTLPIDLPDAATSVFPRDGLDEPTAAQSAIGQRDVRVTPLQMAMVSAAVAHDGQMMQPRVVRNVEDASGRVVDTNPPEEFGGGLLGGGSRAISVETARVLRAMMVEAVATGTGTQAQIEGVDVAGKTGTAEAAEGRDPLAWFTGFAPADAPRVAVAVVITDGGEGATGGAVAAPVAREVMRAALR